MPEEALGTWENPTFSFVLCVTWLFAVYDKVVRLIAVRVGFMGVLQKHRFVCTVAVENVMLCVQTPADSSLIKRVTESVVLLNL